MIAQVDTLAGVEQKRTTGPRYVVKYREGHVRFLTGTAPMVWVICCEDEATVFESWAQAEAAIARYRVPALYTEIIHL